MTGTVETRVELTDIGMVSRALEPEKAICMVSRSRATASRPVGAARAFGRGSARIASFPGATSPSSAERSAKSMPSWGSAPPEGNLFLDAGIAGSFIAPMAVSGCGSGPALIQIKACHRRVAQIAARRDISSCHWNSSSGDRDVKNCRIAASAVALAITASAAHADVTGKDESMIKLATHAGCLTCHSIDGKPHEASDDKPVGPAWHDVAIKYRDQQDAADKLTQTVQHGSSPYEKHWKNTSGLAMPPNAVAISEADTRKLVSWILSLDK